jgi:hypothetical protein
MTLISSLKSIFYFLVSRILIYQSGNYNCYKNGISHLPKITWLNPLLQ